ncbi:hypothetical protein M0811_13847 [Anaeramoeba ignava]|uniref:Uncharacterized protein n=1 Tax=Anaeramoeba ignava TaxID=1746090 RepID=A0A9Q0M079_ANAIG|nr:hypothetical protein M0811_13847 [Anaeramoeba ignava]
MKNQFKIQKFSFTKLIKIQVYEILTKPNSKEYFNLLLNQFENNLQTKFISFRTFQISIFNENLSYFIMINCGKICGNISLVSFLNSDSFNQFEDIYDLEKLESPKFSNSNLNFRKLPVTKINSKIKLKQNQNQ